MDCRNLISFNKDDICRIFDFKYNLEAEYISGYPNGSKGIVTGEVVVFDESLNKDDQEIWKDKVIVSKLDKNLNDFESDKNYKNYVWRKYRRFGSFVDRQDTFEHNPKMFVDTLGIMSRAAIYSHEGNRLRENRVPFLICNRQELGEIKTGDMLRVDLDKGEVSIIEKDSSSRDYSTFNHCGYGR